MYAQLLTFGAAFLGSAVESVEALTIVLAVGLTRGWRAPLYGTVAAPVLLGPLLAFFGQLIVIRGPGRTLKLVIGTLLVLFGWRWLHKAVLRSAGVVAMHDEARAFAAAVSSLQEQREARDWVGFTLAMKGVFLEGLEVVFIVIAVGGTSRGLGVAVARGVPAMHVGGGRGLGVRHPPASASEKTFESSRGGVLSSTGALLCGGGGGAA